MHLFRCSYQLAIVQCEFADELYQHQPGLPHARFSHGVRFVPDNRDQSREMNCDEVLRRRIFPPCPARQRAQAGKSVAIRARQRLFDS